MNFQEWLDTRNGQPIDVDGNWGPQCWDLWSDYAMTLFGASMYQTSTNSGGVYHHPGYACEIWHNFGGNLNWAFTPIGADQPAQYGDVALWEWGTAIGPNSHVALVVEDRGGSIYCLTQNPGNAHYGNLTKNGLLGYLRPDNQSIIGGGSPAAPAPSAPVTAGTSYTVQPGDTLSGIGDRVGINWHDIYNANAGTISNPNMIYVGQVLNIPGGNVPAASAPAASGGGQTYTIVSGDTLWGIAERFYGDGSRYMEIFNASNLSSGNPSLIFPGEVVTIP